MTASTRPLAYRLAIVTSHPVQYQAPLFRLLAAHGDIDLTVYYGHDESVAGDLDPDFGVRFAWDRPLLDGYRSVFLRRSAQALGAIRRLLADARIVGRLRRERFDAVFIHSYARRLSLLAYLGALASRTPVLLRTESERLRPRRQWVEVLKYVFLKPLFGVTSGFLVIGEANRQFFEHYGVQPSRQFFTPYSVDNDYFADRRTLLQSSRDTIRRTHGWTDDVVVVGFCGKLIPLKRVEDLIDTVAVLQREGLRVGVFIVGDGPSRADLEERARTCRLKWTVFAGFKNQSELGACYVCMDAFVLPSRSETWGLVLNEAMLFGLPVVATSLVGATMDLIEPGKNGYVFEVADVRGLTDALRRLVQSSDLRRQFGGRSAAIVRRYSYDQCVRGILDGLQHVTARSRRRSCAASGSPEL